MQHSANKTILRALQLPQEAADHTGGQPEPESEEADLHARHPGVVQGEESEGALALEVDTGRVQVLNFLIIES